MTKIKYDTIGANYNHTRKADTLLSENIIRHLQPTINGVYLDIGCGTGNYSAALHTMGFQVIGIDPSVKMLKSAKRNYPNGDWRLGTAEKTNISEESIDGIFGTLTIHHWENIDAAFLELSRVLKPKGKIVVFTSTPQQMQGYWLTHYFPKMMESSMVQMPALEKVFEAMENAEIKILETEKYFIQPNLQDMFLYCGKHNPAIYFVDAVRNGISSFSSLSNKEEVEKGLLELEKDIESGQIQKIMRAFENNLGDYLYIIGEKEQEML